MKKIIFLLLTVMLSMECVAQNAKEYVQVTTDKEIYLTGEKLLLSIQTVDENHKPLKLSRVAYVELCDVNHVHVQTMVDLKDGKGWAELTLPESMHSGYYEMSVYTRYMRNYGTDSFYRKLIGIVNLLYASSEDDIAWTTEPSAVIVQGNTGMATNQTTYATRSKVTLNLPGNLTAENMTLSVTRRDIQATNETPTVSPQQFLGTNYGKFVPEIEGHIVQAKRQNEESDLVQSNLGTMGLSPAIFNGTKQSDGSIYFYTTDIYGTQQVGLSGYNQDDAACNMVLVSPYAQVLPDKLPKLKVNENDLLADRSIGAQIEYLKAAQQEKNNKIYGTDLLGTQPSISYNLTEYTPMKTINETFIEFVETVKKDKRNGTTYLFTTETDRSGYSNWPALALMDGIPVTDIDYLMNYDARRINYIHIYRGKYTFGGNVYQGVVSFLTFKGNMPEYRLGDNEQLYSYDFPQNHPSFLLPVYENEEQKSSAMPDFRHTLYWNPEVKANSYTFYTSDLTGNYDVVLKGFDKQGKEVLWTYSFVVE